MEESYVCVNETERDEIVKKLQREKKVFRIYLNNEKMMFLNGKRVKYIINVININ